MRKVLLASATLFGVAITTPVLTQTTVTPPAAPGGGTTGGTVNTQATAPEPATSGALAPGETPHEQTTSQPANNKPVEHGPAASERRPHQGLQRRALAAPHATTSSGDENASADQYLRDAQTALRGRRLREAQEALEAAEIRALNSAPGTNAGQNSTVNTIERAREALGHVRYSRPDLARGGQMIDQAMSQTASKSTDSLSSGQSGSTNGTNGSVDPDR
jgi:hypothetical protein